MISERGLPRSSQIRSAIALHVDVDARRDVQHLARDALERRLDDRRDRLGGVLDVQPVAARAAAAVHRQRPVLQRRGDEARDDLLGVLVGPVVVERADDHGGRPVGAPVAVDEAVAAGLRRGVRRARVERVLLVHGIALGGAVDLARGDEDEALDGVPPAGVEQHLGALDVGRHELAGAVQDRLLDVRLGRGVDDHVDARDDLLDVRGIADVALDERQALVAEQVGDVRRVAGVGERVHDHDLVIGRAQQMPAEVRADEAGAAGDEHACHSSTSSIT